MQSKNLIYKNGHFYDASSGKRTGIKDSAKVCVVALEKDFISCDPAGIWPLKISDNKVLEMKIKSDKEISNFKKIFQKGDLLYFTIPRKVKDIETKHEFEVELLEDLYLFMKNSWKLQEGKLYDCACVVKKNICNTIEYFEEVHAQSLNEVYKNTYVHYFGNEGNPACNAIDRFYEKQGKEGLKLRRYRKFNSLF